MTYRQCPICETLVETHEPGVSYIEKNGALYHPECWERETGEPERLDALSDCETPKAEATLPQ